MEQSLIERESSNKEHEQKSRWNKCRRENKSFNKIGEEDENGYSLENSINYCFCRHCLTRILWD